MRAIKKIFTFFITLSVASSWMYGVIPGAEKFSPEVRIAEAANTKIRQEINIIDGYLGAASGSYATSSAIVNLIPAKYSGGTYYFEVVASTSDSISSSAYLKTISGTTVASVSIPSGTTSYARLRSSSFTPNTDSGFNALSQANRAWDSLSVDSSNQNVYATVYNGDIYKQTGGTGDFIALSQTTREWRGISVDSSNQNVYAVVQNGDIYKQTGGTGDFVALNQTVRQWDSITVDSSNQNVYATVYNGDIYKQTGGSGDFVALNQTTRNWKGISVDPSNQNVYAVVYGGDIYKQTGGSGDFVALNQTTRNWKGLSVDPSNQNVYATNYDNDYNIYKQTAGTGDFQAISQTRNYGGGITVDSSNNNVYFIAGSITRDVYKQIGAADYVVVLGNEAGATKGVNAARVVVLQNSANLSNTETQIEIGNKELGKTNTATAALTYPKYWYYDSSKWDGSPTFYAEVSYKDIQISSSTLYTTATTTTRTATYIASPGVSYVQVEAWGAGGGGSIGNAGGGGGGGGAYAKSIFTISAGTSKTLTIPAGGPTDNTGTVQDTTYGSNEVVADNGVGTTGNTAGTGGTVVNSTGQIESAGGAGGLGNTTGDVGGGGGGAGGPDGPGADAFPNEALAGVPSTGGAGDNGSGGSGGAPGIGDGASCPASAGYAGFNHVLGGGGGGGADGNGTNTCTGGAGGYPGGGGGSSELVGADQVGGAGQIKLTEVVGQVGIAIEEDDGNFGNWTFKKMIVSNGIATSSPSRVRSSSFTPTHGRNYRIVASTTSSGASYDIYNAKIIVDQSSPTKFEPQYLLANTLVNSAGLSSFYTLASTTEWSTTNTYVHQIDSSTDSSDSAKLQSNPAGGGTDITGSTATGANRATSTVSGFAFPSGTTAEITVATNVLNAPIYGSRIIVSAEVASLIDLSGVAYSSEGGNNIGTGKTINVYKNGSTSIGTDTTDSNGAWSVSGSISSGDIITAYVSGDDVNANTIFISDGTTQTDIDLYGNVLSVRSDNASAITNANLSTARVSTNDILYVVDGSNVLTASSSVELHVANGSQATDYAPGASLNVDDIHIDSSAAMLAPSSFTLNRNFTNEGTFTHNNGTLNLSGQDNSSIASVANMIFYNLNAATPGKHIEFQKHTANVPTFSFDNLFTVTGEVGRTIHIQSDTPGNQWLVDFNVAQTAVAYAFVRDSACAVGSLSVTYSGTNSGGGNNGTCWNIGNIGADGSQSVTSAEQGSGSGNLQGNGGKSGGGGSTESDGGGGVLQEDGGQGGGGGAVEGASTISPEYIMKVLEEIEETLTILSQVINR